MWQKDLSLIFGIGYLSSLDSLFEISADLNVKFVRKQLGRPIQTLQPVLMFLCQPNDSTFSTLSRRKYGTVHALQNFGWTAGFTTIFHQEFIINSTKRECLTEMHSANPLLQVDLQHLSMAF